MTSAITSATQASAATATQAQPAAKVAASSPKPSTSPTSTDTVQISNAATAMMQEAIETQAQTSKEAGRGDHQAQRLLAKEEAAAKAE